jgi:hypothetical protein
MAGFELIRLSFLFILKVGKNAFVTAGMPVRGE